MMQNAPVLTGREKVKQRMDNEMYLRAHPELNTLISKAVEHILIKRPEASDLHEELCNFFKQPNLKDICKE